MEATHLLLPTCKAVEAIRIGDIVRLEAISNYSKLYFTNGRTLVVAKILRCFESLLPPGQFIRVHRTHIVNKQYIQQCIKGKSAMIQLFNGELIMVSKRKKTHFLRCWYQPAA